MPSVTCTDANSAPNNIIGGNDIARPRFTRLVYSGSLEKFTYNDLTSVIGREFENLQVRDLLREGDDDAVIRDLVITG